MYLLEKYEVSLIHKMLRLSNYRSYFGRKKFVSNE